MFTPLQRLCSYYLECLSLDDDSGVSLFAESRGQADFVPLRSIPGIENGSEVDSSAEVSGLLSQLRRDTNRRIPCIGYPIRLRFHDKGSGWKGFFVEPVFLLPLGMDPGLPPKIGDATPTLNMALLKAVAQGDPTSLMQEAASLAHDIGLWDPGSSDLATLVHRLVENRPDWDWKESIDPERLFESPSIRELTEEGIYNRAILFGLEASNFTKGLEADLSKLQEVTVGQLSGTALEAWLQDNTLEPMGNRTREDPLVEPIPLNSEQRAAVESALTRPLTVVTGPPGTGKSQVVSALLLNAAKLGMRVLFASRNNKAVDVVEARVNALGPRPLLLRLGRGAYQQQLASYLATLLGAQASPSDQEIFAESQRELDGIVAKLREAEELVARLIQLRNEVDELEQSAESVRQALGPDLFASSATFDMSHLDSACRTLTAAVAAAVRRAQPWKIRWGWMFVRRARFRRLQESAIIFADFLTQIGVEVPPQPSTDADLPEWEALGTNINSRAEQLRLSRRYHDRRRTLSDETPLEQRQREIIETQLQLTAVSRKYWDAWLCLSPARLSQQDRAELGNFLSLVQLIAQSDQSNRSAGRPVYANYYKTFPKVAGILNCWAVTSLSARGQIPLEPGFFDLVIIDEASQCDIASAIPLLYRAKRAVIIGDPQQLQHISKISPDRDVNLLDKHGLLATHARWAYSPNSLFTLASSVAGTGAVTMLLDHHRSHGDIIGFANEHFYGGRLRIATRYNELRLPLSDEPVVRWVQVKGRTTRPSGGGALNRAEAEGVVRELERLILEQRYQGTVGIVTPFRAQVNLLNRLLTSHPKSAELRRRTDLLCESAHRFQGDERDIMIFSPVVAEGISRGATTFLQKTGNLFNVAITRARAGMIVVGDATAAAESGIGYLAQFAAYVQGPTECLQPLDLRMLQSALTADYPTVARPELVSDWERQFYGELYKVGLRPIPQYQVEKFALDFAFFDGNRKLNVEVDGERYHKAWNGELLYRDQLRNMRLMELGWDVMRFWVYEIRDAPEECIRKVEAWFQRSSRSENSPPTISE